MDGAPIARSRLFPRQARFSPANLQLAGFEMARQCRRFKPLEKAPRNCQAACRRHQRKTRLTFDLGKPCSPMVGTSGRSCERDLVLRGITNP
jgi:hypothetical protein